MERLSLRDRIHSRYHWIVLIVVFVEYTIAIGLANNLYSLYLIPITNSFGISRGTFSIASSIRYLAAFCSNLLFGLFYNRLGYRRLAAVTLLLTGLAYVGYSTAQNMIPFCIGSAVVGLSESFCGTAGASRLITDWFHKHQGLLLGIVMAASGLGGALFSLIMSGVMARSDYRMALMLSAGLLLLAALMVFVLVRDHPRKMNLIPLGDAEDKKKEREKYARDVKEWDGIPLSVLKKKPAFYYMLGSTFLMAFGTYGIYAIVAAHPQDVGLSASSAALIQSAMLILLAAAKVIEGGLSDKLGPKAVTYLCLVFNVASMVMLAESHTFGFMIVSLVVFALPLAVPSIMLPVLTANMFGRHDYGTILGLLLAMVSLSGVAAGPVINFSYDLLGSYKPALYGMAVVGIITAVLQILAFRGAAREKKRFEEAKNI